MSATTATMRKQAKAKTAFLTAKVAAMSYEERFARLQELSDAGVTDETRLEFAKLLFGAEATVGA